jgi:hypothetical protein
MNPKFIENRLQILRLAVHRGGRRAQDDSAFLMRVFEAEH